MQTDKVSSFALVKAITFIVFVISALFVVRLTPLKEYLAIEKLGALVQDSGFWAPLTFIIIYAAGVSLFVPATIFTTAGAAIFGPYWGFLYAWVGALIGASVAFFIGRYLGRDFAASLLGKRIKKYDDAAAQNGFATVLYLRLIYMPFTPMNFGMGLTRIGFWDYFWGTALGIIVATFIIAFFVGTITDVWISGQWDLLLTWEMPFCIGLFVFSFFIPTLIKRLKLWNRFEKPQD